MNDMSGVISDDNKRLIVSILNAFETGSAEGNYGNISILADGPHGIRQITYGRSQTTEYGLLPKLLRDYIAANGEFSDAFKPYINQFGSASLYKDESLLALLRKAGNDPVMRKTQDEFFDREYWCPAFVWFNRNKFTMPLSMLVIYDSYIQSGCILPFLRKRFPATPPLLGGQEKEWVEQYVDVRHHWLRLHRKPILKKTVYRTSCLKEQIASDNWLLAKRPINANGVLTS